MSAFVTDRRRPGRRGAPAVGVVVCPSCSADEAEAFWYVDSTNFRCTACGFRWLITLGYAVQVGETADPRLQV